MRVLYLYRRDWIIRSSENVCTHLEILAAQPITVKKCLLRLNLNDQKNFVPQIIPKILISNLFSFTVYIPIYFLKFYLGNKQCTYKVSKQVTFPPEFLHSFLRESVGKQFPLTSKLSHQEKQGTGDAPCKNVISNPRWYPYNYDIKFNKGWEQLQKMKGTSRKSFRFCTTRGNLLNHVCKWRKSLLKV